MQLSDLYNPQYSAVTGKKRKIPVSEFILAQIPAMRERYQSKARYDLEKEALEEGKKISLAELSFKKEQLSEAGKQAKISTGINLAQLGLGGAYVGKKLGWWGKGGGATTTTMAPAAAPGTTGAAAPAVAPLTTGAEGGAASTGLKTTALKGAGVVALEYGGRKYGQPEAKRLSHKYPGGEAEWGTAELMARRAGQGAILGGGWGAAAGAGVGLVEGILTGGEGCIIITAATCTNSYEVYVARMFRDIFLGQADLRGYYMIAEKLVPFMQRYIGIKKIVNRYLVGALLNYGECALGLSDFRPSKRSILITNAFLTLCHVIGRLRKTHIRINGERI